MASNERLSDDGLALLAGKRPQSSWASRKASQLGARRRGGIAVPANAGDMIVLPAGVGRRRVGSDDGLKVMCAYPRGSRITT